MRDPPISSDDHLKHTGFARATAVLSFGLVASLAPLMTYAATLHEIEAAWSLSSSQSGWIGGIYFTGYAVAVPFLASASDRMDGRWLYLGSALLGAIASFAFAAGAHGFVMGMILRFLGGVGVAGVHMPGLNLLMERVDRTSQGRATGIYTSVYAAGNAISFMIAGVVDAAFGWRATFVVAGFGPLLSICALGLFLPRPVHRKNQTPRLSLRALLLNKALIAYVAGFAGNTWEVFAVRVWFVAYLSCTLSLPGNHITLPTLGLVAGFASLAGVPVSIAVAELAARIGRRSVIIATCAVSVATAWHSLLRRAARSRSSCRYGFWSRSPVLPMSAPLAAALSAQLIRLNAVRRWRYTLLPGSPAALLAPSRSERRSTYSVAQINPWLGPSPSSPSRWARPWPLGRCGGHPSDLTLPLQGRTSGFHLLEHWERRSFT